MASSNSSTSIGFGIPPPGANTFAHPGADPAELVIASHEKLICFDVEAVATGVGHNDRKPCRVSVVNGEGQTLYDEVIAVPVDEIYDPLTAITGLTLTDIARGVSFRSAQASVKTFCGPGTVLVGQGIDGDIEW